MTQRARISKPIALARALFAYAKIVRDPNQLAEVFQLSDSLSDPRVMERLALGIRKHPGGAEALAARRRVRVDLSEIGTLPEGTLGKAYWHFMKDNNLTPESIPTLAAGDEGAFIRAHLYETHDMWHALTGFDSDVAGELGLQAFYGAQLNGPLPAAILAAGVLNTALFALDDQARRFDAIAYGWNVGKRARPLFGFDWTGSWAKPVAEVRAAMNLPVAGCGRAAIVAAYDKLPTISKAAATEAELHA